MLSSMHWLIFYDIPCSLRSTEWESERDERTGTSDSRRRIWTKVWTSCVSLIHNEERKRAEELWMCRIDWWPQTIKMTWGCYWNSMNSFHFYSLMKSSRAVVKMEENDRSSRCLKTLESLSRSVDLQRIKKINFLMNQLNDWFSDSLLSHKKIWVWQCNL